MSEFHNFNDHPHSYSLDLSGPPKPLVRDHLDLGGTGADGASYAVNSFYIEKNGKPFLPLIGEFHYSRYPAEDWEEELRKMKAGGLNIVASYVFWNLHEQREGHFDWSGQLDLGRFVRTASKVGLDIIIRVGPFGHGEMRNGALPDWIYGRALEVRSNDPLYLDYADKLYAAIGQQVRGLFFKDGGPIIGVQLENELQHSAAPWEIRYADSPREFTAAERDLEVTHIQVSASAVKNRHADAGRDHMCKLKGLAKKNGLDAPLYTATGWGNAAIVPRGSLPVTAAYAYPYWGADEEASPFYLFKDLHQFPDYAPVSYEANLYPALSVELGVGMNQVYSRRSYTPEDSIEPMMVRMLGSGANGLGYYMYHGGATPVFDGLFLNEHTSGLPKIDYDYQAPLGKYGQVRSHYRSLRLMHHLVASFGERLAPMASILPANNQNITPTDTKSLRYAARGANGCGFVFLLNFQDHATTQDLPGLKLEIADGKRSIPVPSRGTFTLKSGAAAILPINLDLDGTLLRCATVQPLCILRNGAQSHFVFFSMDRLAPELVFDAGSIDNTRNCHVTQSNGAIIVNGDTNQCFSFTVDGKPFLIVPRSVALQATTIEGGRLLFTDATVTTDGTELSLVSTGQESVDVNVYPATGAPLHVDGAEIEEISPLFSALSAFRVKFAPVSYSATWRQISRRRYAARFEAGLEGLNDVLMRVNFVGDSGMAFIDGQMVDDHLYSARAWEIGLKRFLPRLQNNEMVFVFHPLERAAADACLRILPAEFHPHFDEGQEKCLQVDGLEFISEYKTVIELPDAPSTL